MSTALITAQIEGADRLAQAVQDYRSLIKDDAGKALAKAARLAALALHREYRKQPPRPRAGTISIAAALRGYRVNSLSRSYLTGMSSARKILGGAKSGYFQIQQGPGALKPIPILLGARGRLLAPGGKSRSASLLVSRGQLSPARRKDLAAYRKLLTQTNRANKTFEARRARVRGNLDSNQLPAGAVQLNAGALAVMRALHLRENAAKGGYLAAQFLTYKGVRGLGTTKLITKDKKVAGLVEIAGDAEGDAIGAQITGYLEGATRIAERYGIVPKALNEAATIYRSDMVAALNRRAAQRFGKVAK